MSNKVKRMHMSYEKQQAWVGFLFLMPWLIGLIMFFLIPLFGSIWFSLTEVNAVKNYATTIQPEGLFENYRYILVEDSVFLRNLTDALYSLAYNVPVIIIFSLFAAVLINQKFLGRTAIRAIFFLPVIVTTGAVMQTFMGTQAGNDAAMSVFNGTSNGGILFEVPDLTMILRSSGLPAEVISYLVIVVQKVFDVVWLSGIQILMFLAALQGISPSLYEASDVEGATAWETFWLITFPNVAPIILVNVVYTIIDTFSSSQNKVISMISEYFWKFRYDWAAAISWIYFICVFVILVIIYLILSKLFAKWMA